MKGSAVPAKRSLTLTLKVLAKFENKQLSNLAKYFSVFEGIMKQNHWKVDCWPLALCTAGLGTKLEDNVNLGVSYKAMRQFSLCMALIWKVMARIGKQNEESFQQFCLHIERQLEQFIKLSVNDNCDLLATFIKYIV